MSCIPVDFTGVRIRAVDEDHVPEHRRINSDDLDGIQGEPEWFEVEVRSRDQDGLAGGRSFTPALGDVLSDQGVDQGALAGAAAAKNSDDKRGFDSQPE